MRQLASRHMVPRQWSVALPELRVSLRWYIAYGAVVLIAGAVAGGWLVAQWPLVLAICLLPVLAIGAGLLAYRAPGTMFALYLAIPFYKGGLQPHLPVDVTLLLVIINVVQVPLLFLAVRGEPRPTDWPRRIRVTLTLWLGFSVPIVFSTLYASRFDTSLPAAINWLLLVCIPCLAGIRLAGSRRFLAQFLWGLFGVGLAVTVVGVWLLPTVGAWPNDRLRVFGNDTIRVGQAALLVPIITGLFVWKQSRLLVRLACLAAVPFSILVSASSGSRGPFLMLALCGMVIGIRSLMLRRWTPGGDPVRVMPWRVVLPIMLCLFLFLVVPPGTLTKYVPATSVARLETLSTILSGFANQDLASEAPDHSTGDRLIAYQFAETMFKERPLLGYGTGSFSALLPQKEDRLTWPSVTAHPHNLILQVAAEHGIVGVLLLALLIGVAVRRVLRLHADPLWNTIGVLFLFFLFCSMVSTEMIDNRTLWGLVVLALMAPEPQAIRRVWESRET